MKAKKESAAWGAADKRFQILFLLLTLTHLTLLGVLIWADWAGMKFHFTSLMALGVSGCLIGIVDLWMVQWMRCRVRAEMAVLSEQDRLTDIYSTQAFSKRLREEISRSKRHSNEFSLAYLSFSSAEAGSGGSKSMLSTAEIRAAAELLVESIRNEDCLSRIRGSEFVLLLPETGKAAADLLAERLVRYFEERPILLKGGRACRIRVLVGTVSYPADGADVEELVAMGEDRARFSNPFLAAVMQ